jgi:signal transduction histidine kinase
MQDRTSGDRVNSAVKAEYNRTGGAFVSPESSFWKFLEAAVLLLAVCALILRFIYGPDFDPAVIIALVFTALVLAFRFVHQASGNAVNSASSLNNSGSVFTSLVSLNSDTILSGNPSADEFQTLFDSIGSGICAIDCHCRVSYANPAAVQLLGATASNLIGKLAHNLLNGAAPPSQHCVAGCSAEDCPDDDCALRRVAGNRLLATGESILFRDDGSSFPAEYFLTPLIDEDSISGYVFTFHDISQRQAVNQLKDEFISTVSHELRTPLTSIHGALGLLASGVLGEVNDKAANLLRIAYANSERLTRLINDILDLERLQSGREPFNFRPVRLADVVAQAIDGIMPVAYAAGVQLVHDPNPIEVISDPDRLLQVVTNLLSNAVKFSPNGTTVSVVLSPGAQGVTLSVIDQGRGIPADKLETIFGRFQQIHGSDARQKGGSGLGLAICRSIVQKHSGRIWAERNPDCGSTFHVFLPYNPEPVDVQNTPVA